MVNTAFDARITWFQSFLCGGTSAVLARSLTSPLEVVKVLAQVGTQEAKPGLIRTFASVYKREGIKAFWKGNGVSCIRLFPYSAVQYAAFNRIVASLEDPHNGELSDSGSMLAGTSSTLIAMVTVYPCEVIKTRLTVQHVNKSNAHYKGMRHALKTILREEGILALYKGVTPSFLGLFPFAGGSFLAYQILDKVDSTRTEPSATPICMFVNGCVAGAFAHTLSHPFDTIRKKMQAKSTFLPKGGGVDVEFVSMSSCFVQTVRVNGFTGLWRGLVAHLLKVVPNAGIVFLTYEYMRRLFLYHNGYTESPWTDTPKPGIDQNMAPHELRYHSLPAKDR
ncbi:predicted protein [Nematostella vectensis]|uniref:Mitochondrial carrier protein n=1 Tax=Nematostella vectensis TaxID=45351 RepID=A7SLQ3_NEMVE|nr:predicted protein [Nematostella vectensis]|eukprot:XP_001627437.1 predicted protein [Nematostella vectensis]